MLAATVAQERLKELEIKDWVERRLVALASLPDELHFAGRMLMRKWPETMGKPSEEAQAQARAKAEQAIETAADADRQCLFGALFPGIAPYVEQAWQLKHRLPYQASWRRRAFRASRHAELTRHSRHLWLSQLYHIVQGYEQDITWYATWAAYLGYNTGHILGVVFAAAIDSGTAEGEAVLATLLASARGDHEIGAMGRHVTCGLLTASRPAGWEFVEKMLIAGQRQEGLRQVILETIDEAHQEAFRRMLRLIVDHDLTRFAATVRAVDVWFGYGLDSASAKQATEVVRCASEMLGDEIKRQAALASGDGPTTYLALWACATEDAVAAIEPARRLLEDSEFDRRYIATHFLTQLELDEGYLPLLHMLEDEDFRIVVRAMSPFIHGVSQTLQATDLFERIERALPRFPKRATETTPSLWSWYPVAAIQSYVAPALLESLGQRSPTRLIPYLNIMEPNTRRRVIDRLITMGSWDTATRDTLFKLVGDRSGYVSEAAINAVAHCQATETEVLQMEGLLTRKSSGVRRGIIGLLLNQGDDDALASVRRLLNAPRPEQRLAGLELCRELRLKGRQVETCRALASDHSQRHTLSETEQIHVETILEEDRPQPTLDNGLGLFDPADRTQPTTPFVECDPQLVTSATVALLRSLDDLIHTHRSSAIPIKNWQGEETEVLLGNVGWQFPQPDLNNPLEVDWARFPLAETWETWWRERPQSEQDHDQLELIRALAQFYDRKPWRRDIDDRASMELLLGGGEVNDTVSDLRYQLLVQIILSWLLRAHPTPGSPDFLLDVLAQNAGAMRFEQPDNERYVDDWSGQGWRSPETLAWLSLNRYHRAACPTEWTDPHHARFWRLLRWIDQPAPQAQRRRPLLEETLMAYRVGAASEADILDQLIGPRQAGRWSTLRFDELGVLTARQPSPLLAEYPILNDLVQRCRDQIIKIELARGDLPTSASLPALQLGASGGLATLIALLQAMGRLRFTRGYQADRLSRAYVYTHLIQVTQPSTEDTPDAFATAIKTVSITQPRLLELVMLAPQWASHIEHTLTWPGLAEGVWWLYAHTHWEAQTKNAEENFHRTQVAERTPLTFEALDQGAVDVAWFQRVYSTLGADRWAALASVAKTVSNGTDHKRALLFADAILGHTDKETLVKRMMERRYQDAVRALGLLPLTDHNHDTELLDRYQTIQEFLRSGQKFGAQRRGNEALAASIALDNMARAAGYVDPIRFEWAMEIQAVNDLAQGPISVTVGEAQVSLAIDPWGKPTLTATKRERTLKAIPPRFKREPEVKALIERRRDLERQASRTRRSLEAMMCRRDEFTGAELRQLMRHPLLEPMLRGLVFIGHQIIGYPIEGGVALQTHTGHAAPLGNTERVRIAHPYDLLQTHDWHLWQRECFTHERIQPFKQVFRELYVITASERADRTLSRRYAGQQVNPRQAMALLNQRGWMASYYNSPMRVYHEYGLTAHLDLLWGGGTPADVDGWTIETIYFTRSGAWERLPLTEIAPHLFSETMRDLDLLVSVAHRGGVDPEASASTVEMRAALLREICNLLGLNNVTLQPSHAIVEGQLSSYNIHLGSGSVHRQPGGYLCIIPVHSQHRGRIFLPFADDDPRTAEIMSKVLLLARDTEIKDPTILEQILA